MLAILATGIPWVGAYCVLAQWPLWSPADYPLAAANLTVTLTFFATAVFVASEPLHLGTGAALATASLLWPLNWVNEWNLGPLPLIAALDGPAASFIAVWALMRYPVRWRHRWQDRLTAVALVTAQLLSCLQVVTSRPRWHGLSATTTWLVWWPDHRAYAVARAIYDTGGLLAATAAAAAIVVRLTRLPDTERRVMRAVLLALPVAGVLAAASNLAAARHLAAPLLHPVYAVQCLSLTLVPAAFMLAAVRRWFTRERIPRFIRDLGPAPTPDAVQAGLRDAFSDPTLQVLYQVDGGYVDVQGAPKPPPPDRGVAAGTQGPIVLAVVSTGNKRTVVLTTTQPHIARYASSVNAAAQAAALLLENTRLLAEIAARIHDTQQSQRRVVSAVEAERARVQLSVRDLADGELRRIEECLSHLPWPDGPDTTNHIKAARALVNEARADLLALAAGIPPSMLAELGLSRAVRAAADRLRPGIRQDLCVQRLPADIERSAYFVLLELLTNAVKHAGESDLAVTTHVLDHHLVLQVKDSGPGGADERGSGLSGVSERVRGLGGTITIHSQRGAGTRVLVSIPLPQPAPGPPTGRDSSGTR